MKIWRAVLRELGVAWRSLRYDLGRPTRRPDATAVIPAAGSATAGGTGEPGAAYDAYFRRRPQRIRAALVVAVLATGGAAATYLGVVGALSALLPDDPHPPSALPRVSAEADPSPQPVRPLPRSRPGAAPETLPPATPPAATAPPVAAPPADPPPPASEPSPESTRRTPPIPSPAPGPCTCSHPPAPPPPPPPPTGSPEPTEPPCEEPASDPDEPTDPCQAPTLAPGERS